MTHLSKIHIFRGPEMNLQIREGLSTRKLQPWISSFLVGVLLLILVFQLVLSVRQETQVADEALFIFSGYSYWKSADYGMNPETPPLIKLLDAAPLLNVPLQQPAPGNRWFKVEPYIEGRDFLYKNDADRILFRSRMVAICLTVLLALLVFAAANTMFGPIAALVSLAFIVFEPNILAHGGLATIDAGFSCFMLAAIYAFYRYAEAPTVWRLVTAGVAFGLAVASKHTGVFVGPILLLLAVCELVPSSAATMKGIRQHKRPIRILLALLIGCMVSFALLTLLCGLMAGVSVSLMAAAQYTLMIALPALGLKALFEFLSFSPSSQVSVKQRIRSAARLAIALLSIAVVAIIVLWSTYGFHYAARPEGLHMNPPLAEFQKELRSPLEEHLISTLARFHILPEAYLYGLVDVRKAAQEYHSYLLGHLYLQGKWFYFPMAFVIKSTAAFLIMIALSAVAIVLCQFDAKREIVFLVVPVTFYFIVAMSSGLNIGIRHVLPVYPLLSILVGGGAASLMRHRRGWAYVVVALLAWHAASSLHAFPTYLAYANELWGGPSHTYRYLSDSNVDWGQQLKSVSHYIQQNRIKNCHFAYILGTLVDLNHYGIPCMPLMTTRFLHTPIDTPSSIEGPLFISATVLSGSRFGPGEMNPFVQFQQLRPTAVIDDGVFVFDGHFDIPVASGLDRADRAYQLMEEGRLVEALGEAQMAVNIAPNAMMAQFILGDALKKLNRLGEARVAYQKALALSKSLGAEHQDWMTAAKNTVEKRSAN